MFKQQSSKYSLFLLELIIAIFFFSISSAVCVQLYAKANVLSTSTKDLNIAITKVEGAAEVIKSDPLDPNAALLSAFSDSIIEGQTIQIGYNQNWEACPLSEASYLMKIDWQHQNQIVSATIDMRKLATQESADDIDIYDLNIIKHIPNTIN